MEPIFRLTGKSRRSIDLRAHREMEAERGGGDLGGPRALGVASRQRGHAPEAHHEGRRRVERRRAALTCVQGERPREAMERLSEDAEGTFEFEWRGVGARA